MKEVRRSMASMEIRHRWEPRVLWQGEAGNIKDAVIAALAEGANLSGANLSGADFSGANFSGANLSGALDVVLPTGETWIEYLTITVPALLTATGKSIESCGAHFACHTWSNCPMAYVFDTSGIGEGAGVTPSTRGAVHSILRRGCDPVAAAQS